MNLLFIVLFIAGILIWAGKFKPAFPSRANFSIPRRFSVGTLPFWLPAIHTVALLLLVVLQAGSSEYVTALKLFYVVDFPWALIIVMFLGTTPGLDKASHIYTAIFVVGMGYWYLVGLVIKLIAENIAGRKLDFDTEPTVVEKLKPAMKIKNPKCEVCGEANNPSFKQCWSCKHVLGQTPLEEKMQAYNIQKRTFKSAMNYALRPANIFTSESFRSGLLLLPSVLIISILHYFLSKINMPSLGITAIGILVGTFTTGVWVKFGFPKFFNRSLASTEEWLSVGFKIEFYSAVAAVFLGFLLMALLFVVFAVLGVMGLIPAVQAFVKNPIILSALTILGITLNVMCHGVIFRYLYENEN